MTLRDSIEEIIKSFCWECGKHGSHPKGFHGKQVDALEALYKKELEREVKGIEDYINKAGEKEYDGKIITISMGTNWLTTHWLKDKTKQEQE